MSCTFLGKRGVRRAFEKFVNPETVESLLHDGVEQQPLKTGRIEFVLGFVRGKGPAQVSEHVGHAVELAATHGGMVHDVVGALVIVAFGTHPASAPESGSRTSLVGALHKQLGDDIKIVHGTANGHYGLLGSGTRMSYTFLVSDFDRILGALGRLEFGESEEFGQ